MSVCIREQTMTFDLEDLVHRCSNGDSAAFKQLVNRYGSLVTRVIYLRVGCVNQADELCRDVFVRMYQSVPSLSNPLLFLSRLLATTHEAIAERHGDLAHEVFLEDWQEDARVPDEPRDTSLPGRVSCLPETQQEVVRLRYLQGFDYHEIASRLGLTLEEVSLSLRQAKAQLRLHANRRDGG